MRVLFVTSTYPTPEQPHQGSFNRVLVDSLRRSHDVRVIAPVPWTQVWSRPTLGRAVVSSDFSTRIGDYFPVYYYPPKLLRSCYHIFFWYSIRDTIRRLTKDFEPEIVMGYWLHPDGAAAVRIAAGFGVPAIVMSGGTDLRILTKSKQRAKEIARVLHAAERIVVFSRELAIHAERLGIEPGKIEVIYRGVDRECFRPIEAELARKQCGLRKDDVVIFWAGRLVSIKNPALLLQAALQWKSEWGERLRVVVAGDGPLRRELELLRNTLGLSHTVVFKGNLSQSDFARHYNAADVTVLTSHSEGIPNVLLESIACQTPFVASRVGGIPEIATTGVDTLFDDNDLEVFIAAVKTTVSRQKCQLTREFEPSDTHAMAERMQQVISRVLRTSSCVKSAA